MTQPAAPTVPSPSPLRRLKHALINIVYQLRTLPAALGLAKRRRLIVFYLYADTRKYPHSLPQLEKILARLHGVDVTLLTIDNFNTSKPVPQSFPAPQKGITRLDVPGDNAQWEFSGWKRGVKTAESLGLAADYVLFVNDAFLNQAADTYDIYYYRNALNTLTLAALGRHALGKLCQLDNTHAIKGQPANEWIQSNFLIVPWDIAKKLDFTGFSETEISALFPTEYTGELIHPMSDPGITKPIESASTIVLLPSANATMPIIPPDPSVPLISADLRDFLIEWITNGWPSRVPASTQTYPLLRAKMLAILNERMLAIEIKALGCPLRHMGRTKVWLGRCEITPDGMKAP